MARKKSSARRNRVRCARHGESDSCIICRHLRESTGLGYYAIRNDPWAWCELCDAVLDAEQGWSNRLYEFADWQVHCRACFRGLLRRHQRIAWIIVDDEDE